MSQQLEYIKSHEGINENKSITIKYNKEIWQIHKKHENKIIKYNDN